MREHAGSIRIASLIYNDILRQGVRVFIETESKLELVHSLKSFDASTAIVLNARVDLALIDLDLPGQNSLDAIRSVRAINAEAWILGLTTYEPEDRMEDALLAGASRIVGKHEISEAILDWMHDPRPAKVESRTKRKTPSWRTYLRGFLFQDKKKSFW